MNGAAMNCQQEAVLHSQNKSSSGQNPGYFVELNHLHHQISHPQHSKMNYQSFSSNLFVDGFSDYPRNDHTVDSKLLQSGEMKDPRTPGVRTHYKEPLELPVPQFEIDKNFVGDPSSLQDILAQSSKALDLDTRIDLLIKSKALAGMHPIFSELDKSEESDLDSDEFFVNKPNLKNKQVKRQRSSSPKSIETHCFESFDDPETPLSRPPSPFLSRATYLFWFNKAIELKQQAKAQEQALLEIAAKKVLQDSSINNTKTNQTACSNDEAKPIFKSLLDEISKEVKEAIKQEFLRDVIEKTAFHTLDNWWEMQKQMVEEDEIITKDSISSTVSDNFEHINKKITNKSSSDCLTESQGSTSPKDPYPWGSEKIKCREKKRKSKK